MLYVVAFPHLAPALLAQIEAIRTQHSEHANRIAAHITFVFGTADPVDAVTARLVQAARRPAFTVRFGPAIPGEDSDGHYAFLPATEPAGTLRDIYRTLNPHPSRPADDFVAHITLANSPDRSGIEPALARAATLPLPAEGTIDALVLLRQSEHRLDRVAAFKLDA
ncbi:2'-5' RNA ligase family protein [Pelagibacterium halotolerans]|uniref:2'-5' RNA ligase family protein n=1 Tax=Pelagibacterium halotolerans TaxID=531813 RepID=UPI00384F0F01